MWIRVITKLPNSEQSYKGKVKTHKYINRQNQSPTGKLWKRNDPDLVQAFLKKWWVELYIKAPNPPLSLQIINDGISNDSVDKQSSGSKFSNFGPTSFSGVYNVKDYQIFNSTLGRLVPTCDKAMSNLLGSKPVDGLRLSQATWSM